MTPKSAIEDHFERPVSRRRSQDLITQSVPQPEEDYYVTTIAQNGSHFSLFFACIDHFGTQTWSVIVRQVDTGREVICESIDDNVTGLFGDIEQTLEQMASQKET